MRRPGPARGETATRELTVDRSRATPPVSPGSPAPSGMARSDTPRNGVSPSAGEPAGGDPAGGGPAGGTPASEGLASAQRAVPAIYSSAALAADVTALCQELLRPHLEADEVALVANIDIRHRVPITEGAPVHVQATVATVTSTRLVCEYLVRSGSLIAARGTCELEPVRLAAFRTQTARAG